MKLEEHFKDTLERAVANEPPVFDPWATFERGVRRHRRVRLFGSFVAIVAVLVAAVIVVPKLGGKPVVFGNSDPTPGSPSPSPTQDAYAGWDTFTSPTEERYAFRYPGDWRVARFENAYDVIAPGRVGPVEGSPTAAVTVEFLSNEEFDSPFATEQGFDRSTRADGRPFVWKETLQVDGGVTILYRFDWSTCVASITKGCIRGRADTLVVSVELSTPQLAESYRASAERIVGSIAYVGPVGPIGGGDHCEIPPELRDKVGCA
jgi:hypothetical protein